MSLKLRNFNQSKDIDLWEQFCGKCLQSTFLHTYKFISYHKNRYNNKSLIIEYKNKIVGIFPAAIDPNNSLKIISHPGITFGGILHQGQLNGELMVNAIKDICIYYKRNNFKYLIYKPVPTFYHKVPVQDDLFALARLKAKKIKNDLSSTIDLTNRNVVSKRRSRSLKKSIDAKIHLSENKKNVKDFWDLLSLNLKKKFNVEPVHTEKEIKLLSERFPNNIKFTFAFKKNNLIGGVITFISHTSYHSQYIASNEVGKKYGALDAIFNYLIKEATEKGKKWFDFGISTNSNNQINEGLYKFKNEFGGGGFVYEQYELEFDKIL